MPSVRNPITGINYDTDRFVVFKDGAPTTFDAKWGRLDGGPIVGGLPAGQTIFWVQPEADRSIYDHRLVVTGRRAATPYSPAKPEGWPTGTWDETLTVEFRPAAELKAQVDAARRRANSTVYPDGDQPAEQALVDNARANIASGTADTTDSAVMARHEAKVDLMKQNETRAAELYAAIDDLHAAITAGLLPTDPSFPAPYDITEGWKYGDGQVAI